MSPGQRLKTFTSNNRQTLWAIGAALASLLTGFVSAYQVRPPNSTSEKVDVVNIRLTRLEHRVDSLYGLLGDAPKILRGLQFLGCQEAAEKNNAAVLVALECGTVIRNGSVPRARR